MANELASVCGDGARVEAAAEPGITVRLPAALAAEFEIVWSPALERAGLAAGLSRYIGASSIHAGLRRAERGG